MWADLGDPSGMGSGQPPPKVIATQRSGIWGVVGTFFGRCLLRDVGPEGHVPKKNRRRGAVRSRMSTPWELSLPTIAVPDKSPRTPWRIPKAKPARICIFPTSVVVFLFRFMSRKPRPEPELTIARSLLEPQTAVFIRLQTKNNVFSPTSHY